MVHVTLRRFQGDAARSASDFDARSDDVRSLERRLADLLRTAQLERGRGIWSDIDPEIRIAGALVARLRRHEEAARVAREVFRAVIPATPRGEVLAEGRVKQPGR